MSEVFDCRKGYPPDKYPSTEEEARNAYYQGFITDWERKQLVFGYAIINYHNELVWLRLPAELDEFPTTRLLTKDRMHDIKVDHMLGVSDGKTLID